MSRFLPIYRALAAAPLALALAATANAATITIVNNDGVGEGFNDTTPVAALPNNPGTTLGAQRLNVFTTAANQWGAVLNSPVTILIRAQMDPQTCDANGAILGSAGPLEVAQGFTNAPVTNTWFVIAEVNALVGTDQSPTNPDINATFNVSIDAACLPGTTGWWYGLDNTQPVPADKIALMPVVFHEIAHGLGFLSITNSSTGQFFSSMGPGRPDIWAHFLTDLNLGASGTLWRDMTNNQRKASAIDDPNLVWAGANVTARGSSYLDPPSALIINSPAGIAGTYPAQSASYGLPPPLAGLSGDVVLAVDSGGASVNDGCEPLTNGAQISGKIALIDRGTCNFTVKSANAQAVGAIGVLVANNVATGLPGMGGSDPSVIIPSYGITQADGTSIKNNLAGGVNVTMGYDFSRLSGTNGGFVRLYAPNPLEPGSSVSHFSADAIPDLLMEPALNQSLFSDVDLTVALFNDIFWPLNPQANKAPTISAASQFNVLEDTLSPLTEILFSDQDSGTGNLTLSLQVGAGTLDLLSQAGITVTGSGTSTATASGPRLALLQYVTGGNVRYLTPLNSEASTSLDLGVNDNGNTGTGGALSATANATIVVTPTPEATTTTITSDNPDPSISGETVTVNFTVVVVPPAVGTPTGSVTVTASGGAETCTGSVATGNCQLALNGVGARTLTASYAGNASFAPSSGTEAHTVNKADSTTTITADNADPSLTGEAVTVAFSVTPIAPGSGTPTGTVTITASGGSETCSASVAIGNCQLTLTAAGARTLTATYVGDANFNGSSDTEAHTVNPDATTTTIASDLPDPSNIGQDVVVVFGVTANAPGSGTPTGTVTVTASGGSETCSASVATGNCTITLLAPGARTLTASYSGDVDFTASSDTEAHGVTGLLGDLSISKTDNASAVVIATSVSYTIVVSNAGPDTATGALVTDAPPAELTGATWTCTSTPPGLCPNTAGPAPISETVTLASGQTLTYTLTGTVGGAVGGTLTNSASVAAPAGFTDPTPGNNDATDVDQIVADGIFANGFE